jgi:Flp pilus assembly protein TadB
VITPAALAAVTAACLTAGLLLAVLGLVGTRRPPSPPSASALKLLALLGVGLPPRTRRRRQVLAGAAVAATTVGWLVTGWPVGGLVAGLAAVGVPWLVTAGAAEREMIARLEAVEVWTRRLADLVRTGHGLVSAIVTSARTTPAAITEPVADLAAGLRAGADPQVALDRFADALADAKADEVIAALKLHAGDRGQRLSDILTSVAASAADEVVMRRGVAAKRAEPRFVTRFMTGLIAVVLGLVFTNTTYAKPYGSWVGQLVLLAATLLLIAMLAWIRALTQPARQPRFLRTSPRAPTDRPTGTSSAVLSLTGGRR